MAEMSLAALGMMPDMRRPEPSLASLGQQKPIPFAYPLMPQQTHLPQAEAAMNLTPQEQALYMRHITNLYGPGGVDNAPTPQEPQGSRSTLYQSVDKHNGRFYSLPNVWDGRIEPEKQTLQNVAKIGWENFPSYATGAEADARYMQMHEYMDRDMSGYFKVRR